MSQTKLTKVDGVLEHETMVLDGMDISGHWNRIFDQRAIMDYDQSALDWIVALEGGESLGACYQCGKCVPVCPVEHVGDYGPRKLFRKVQIGSKLMDDPDLWLCTTCGNCLRVCPKGVDMIQIMPAIREQAVLEGELPDELMPVFESLQRQGNPLGEPARKRAEWIKDAGVPVPLISELKRPVDVLWYVGDYTSYHPRGKDAARAMAHVLHALGIDYAILGPEERSDGDSARLVGERGLFELLAEQNIRALGKYEFNKLLVVDPHAYNAFRTQYPKLGGEYDVVHYTQFLAPLIDRLTFARKLDLTVTFHDPCYLGRHHGEYDAPRKLLEAIPGVTVVEMAHYRANGFCCGGGGGGMWLDGHTAEHTRERLSERRVREAVDTGAAVLGVCCPYEPSRFEDAVKSTGNDGRIVVRDIIELIWEAMQEETPR